MHSRKKIVVITQEVTPGKMRIALHGAIRDQITQREGEDIKVTFFHCKHFLSEDKFCQKKVRGASLLVSTIGQIKHPSIKVVDYSTF